MLGSWVVVMETEMDELDRCFGGKADRMLLNQWR